jgi:hypothetical protein
MSKPLPIPNLLETLAKKSIPTVKVWNRLEGRPKSANFDRALKAEVRDALWMLTKQWQMGEFAGDDAGSPVTAKVHITTTQLTKYKAGGKPATSFDNDVPLEAKVEQQNIRLSWNNQVMHIDLRLQLGRRWLKLLSKNPLINGLAGLYKTKYSFILPAEDAEGSYVYAHKEAWQQLAAITDGRCMDGGKLYLYLKENITHSAADDILMSSTQSIAINNLAIEWMEWFDLEMYYKPVNEVGQPLNDGDAWKPSYLEYNCEVSAPLDGKEKVMTANEYYSGHLDWFSFDVDTKQAALGETDPPLLPVEDVHTRTFLPTAVTFDGMPNTRWWKFEDSKTNFGDIKPSTTDLAKLLLIEFGLVYANDWFTIPFKIPVGTLADVRGLAVTNTFGERIWVEASGRGQDDNWHRWNMFTMSVKGTGQQQADTSLPLLPTVFKIQESDPLEEVVFVRDEMANMVWAIETRVPLLSGFTRPGKEMADETLQYHTRLIQKNAPLVPVPLAPLPFTAPISYLAMTTVPENWIPFIPVHIPGSNREIQLQRAAMLRIIEGDPNPLPPKIRPQNTLLRFGLDGPAGVPVIPVIPEIKQSYFLHEEEILKAGIKVSQSFQRTRWNNGKVFVWLGLRKETGRGEGSSGLAFDQIKDVKKG